MSDNAKRIVTGISLLLNIAAMGVWADWYWTHKHISQYQQLIEAYEEIGDTDADMILNCADVVELPGSDKNLASEELNQKVEEATEIYNRMLKQDRVINNLRTELGLD